MNKSFSPWYKPIDQNICIIVLNWENWQDTVQCLTSLQSLPAIKNISVIVCDNGSSNHSVHQILSWARHYYSTQEIRTLTAASRYTKSTLSPFVLIQTGENLGFAGGNNVGIRFALAQERYDYIWLLNSDTVVDIHALASLYGFAQTYSKTALIGSTVLYYDQPDIVQSAGGCRYNPFLTKIDSVFDGEPLDYVEQFNHVDLDYIYGASLFLRVSAIRSVGLLNEEYFLFYEELDYTQRLKKRGYQIAWCPYSLVFHKGSATIKYTNPQARQRLQFTHYYENLNTLKYSARCHFYSLPFALFSRLVLKSFLLVLRRQFFLFPSLLKAYWDFFHYSLFPKSRLNKKTD